MKKLVAFFLSILLFACAPIAVSRNNQIPILVGETWKLEILDTQGKTVWNQDYVRQGQYQSFSALVSASATGLVFVPTNQVLKFQSGAILLENLNLTEGGEIAEIRAGQITGVIHFAKSIRDAVSLVIYPDNTNSKEQQSVCIINNPQDKLILSGLVKDGSCRFSKVSKE